MENLIKLTLSFHGSEGKSVCVKEMKTEKLVLNSNFIYLTVN